MDEMEFEMRADEAKRIAEDLHEQGLSDSDILHKLLEWMGTPLTW